MSNEFVAEAMGLRQKRLEECNGTARRLMGETEAAMKGGVEDVLALDGRRLLTLAMDLIDALAHLRAAHNNYESLRRRQT